MFCRGAFGVNNTLNLIGRPIKRKLINYGIASFFCSVKALINFVIQDIGNVGLLRFKMARKNDFSTDNLFRITVFFVFKDFGCHVKMSDFMVKEFFPDSFQFFINFIFVAVIVSTNFGKFVKQKFFPDAFRRVNQRFIHSNVFFFNVTDFTVHSSQIVITVHHTVFGVVIMCLLFTGNKG